MFIVVTTVQNILEEINKLIISNTDKKLKTSNQKTYGKSGKTSFDVWAVLTIHVRF